MGRDNNTIATPSSNSTIVHTVGPYDILCGRCKEAYNNIGNRRFRVTVNLNLQKYLDAPSRGAKGDVVMSVVKILTEEVGARFLKQEGDHYVELNRKSIREKVAHAMRDMSAKHQNHLQQQQQEQQCGENDFFCLANEHGSSTIEKRASFKSRRRVPSSAALRRLEMADESRLLKSLEQEIKFESILAKVLANAGMPPGASARSESSVQATHSL